MECTVEWIGHRSFVAATGSGHTVVMDGAPESGGRNLAPRPMEMMLVSLGGCTAFDVVMILEKGRHQINTCQVKITGERADTDPKIFTEVHLHYTVKGNNLPKDAVERAVKLSAEKYCSASAIISATAKITHTIEMVE